MVRINSHNLRISQIGKSGSVIILLTGFATTSNFWNKDFIVALACEHQVYLVDYQGVLTPDSKNFTSLTIADMANDINCLVKALNLIKPMLLGWSMGGAVTLQASFMEPALYSQLVLLAGVVPTIEPGFSSSIRPHQQFFSEDDILNYVFSNNIFNYSPNELTKYRSKFLDQRLAMLFPRRNILDIHARAIRAWRLDPASSLLFKSSKLRATFYLPLNDTMLDQQLALKIIKDYPNANIIELADCGHAVSWHEPFRLAAEIYELNSGLI